MQIWRFFPFIYSAHPIRDFVYTCALFGMIGLFGMGTLRQAVLVASLANEPTSIIASASPTLRQKSSNFSTSQKFGDIDETATGSISQSYGGQSIHLDPCTGLVKN